MRTIQKLICLFWAFLLTLAVFGCSDSIPTVHVDNSTDSKDGMGGGPLLSSETTYATSFTYPVKGFSYTDFGFGFAKENPNFSGLHLGADTLPDKTPFGTPVIASADGIVRVSTDKGHSAYGSDSATNPYYYGCVILIEHKLTNGNRFLSVIGHVQCEHSETYSPETEIGNPHVGDQVHKGQYIGHVAHYWHGSGTTNDWHHIHFGIRRITLDFNAECFDGELDICLAGYAPKSDFTPLGNGNFSHPYWLDPIDFVEAHSETVAPIYGVESAHQFPSGSMLIDPSGTYWMVVSNGTIAKLTPSVIASDRYDTNRAVLVSTNVINCFTKTNDIASPGDFDLYVRPGSNAVVIAYKTTRTRYDFINWDAFLSWGFQQSDIQQNSPLASYYESSFLPFGYKLIRPGTLVKGSGGSAVSIVTWQHTRKPIVSETVFNQLRFNWNAIVTVSQSLLDQIAGPQENPAFSIDDINSCPAQPYCSVNSTCGGGVADSTSGGSSSLSPATSSTGGSISVGIQNCNRGTYQCTSNISQYQICILNTSTGNTDWQTFSCATGDACTASTGRCETLVSVSAGGASSIAPASNTIASNATTGGSAPTSVASNATGGTLTSTPISIGTGGTNSTVSNATTSIAQCIPGSFQSCTTTWNGALTTGIQYCLADYTYSFCGIPYSDVSGTGGASAITSTSISIPMSIETGGSSTTIGQCVPGDQHPCTCPNGSVSANFCGVNSLWAGCIC